MSIETQRAKEGKKIEKKEGKIGTGAGDRPTRRAWQPQPQPQQEEAAGRSRGEGNIAGLAKELEHDQSKELLNRRGKSFAL